MKFLCDAMLAHVGKLLREAGYDTRIDRGLISDFELVVLALEEGRWLLTCDHTIREIKGARHILIHLSGQGEEEWARYLACKLGVNWLYAPLTRCLECNCLLSPAGADATELVPDSVKQEGLPLLQCPECHKVFWEGNHAKRMRAHLEFLNSSSRKSPGGMPPCL